MAQSFNRCVLNERVPRPLSLNFFVDKLRISISGVVLMPCLSYKLKWEIMYISASNMVSAKLMLAMIISVTEIFSSTELPRIKSYLLAVP